MTKKPGVQMNTTRKTQLGGQPGGSKSPKQQTGLSWLAEQGLQVTQAAETGQRSSPERAQNTDLMTEL